MNRRNNYNRRDFLKTIGAVTAISATGIGTFSGCVHGSSKITNKQSIKSKPNLIVIFADDLGYGDLGCYGSKVNRTPYINSLAENGVKFTDFHMVASICSPARSALLTGCYPKRIGMSSGIIRPGDKRGINPNELNIAKVAKACGYKTCCAGKWHLGDQPKFLPTRVGFDTYFGLLYLDGQNSKKAPKGKPYPPLPLVKDDEVIEQNPDRTTITKRMTDFVTNFIDENKDNPFMIYMPHIQIGRAHV